MGSLIDIGINSLMANQFALTIASQNIANANLPSYTRRVVDFKENPFNQGVSVSDVRRIVDNTALENLQNANTNFAQASQYLSQLQHLGTLFDDNTSGIGKYITDSISTLEKLNGNAASPQNRGFYLSSLAALANRFQNIDGQLSQQIQETNRSLQINVDHVNNLLNSIATVNNELSNPATGNVPALQDQRNGLVQELSQYLNFTTQTNSSGLMSINLSNGFSLVTGGNVIPLTTIPDPNNSTNSLVAIKPPVGNPSPIMDLLQGGQLAGLIKYQQQALVPTQQGLGRLALAFADEFNKQNKLGIDLNGNLGGNIFNDINSVVVATNRIIANTNNTGTGNFTVDITDTSKLQVSDYKLTLGAANSYVLTRLSDNKEVGSGTIGSPLPQTISVDGFRLNLNTGSTLNAGDQYLISPTRGAANNFGLANMDPSKLALAWPVMASVGSQPPGSLGEIKVTDVTDTTTSAFSVPKQLTPPLQIRFLTSTTYEIVNMDTSTVMQTNIPYVSGGKVFPTPAPTSYDPGYQITISNNVLAGATFNIGYNTNQGANDNGLAMAKLYDKKVVNDSTLTFGQAYGNTASRLAILTNQTKAGYDAMRVVYDQARETNDRISGVSLQEETMDIARYQQAYQASAQILETAKAVLQAVLSIARG